MTLSTILILLDSNVSEVIPQKLQSLFVIGVR